MDITTLNDEPGINHIPIEAFGWFPNLESLRVKSKVTAIRASDLELATNLTELIVSNQLQIIERGIFPTKNKLMSLSFESNRISSVDDFSFERLTRLFALKLQKNQLTEVREHTFDGLFELIVLNLSQNRIRTIPSGVFASLPKLQFLLLQQNQLATLYDSIFNGLGNLLDISLASNQIRLINKSLNSLRSIKKIDLSNNQISDLDLNDFVQFASLIDLRLINSGFSFAKTTASHNSQNPKTSKLKYLYLDKNNLSDPLELQTLDIFSELIELSLDDNSYRDFDFGSLKLNKMLPQLEKISLDGNKMSQRMVDSINAIIN